MAKRLTSKTVAHPDLLPASGEKEKKSSKPEHEQHGLVALLLELRAVDVLADGDPAQAGQDRHILLAADLEGHRRRIKTDPDIDLPERLHGGVVERHHGSVREAREHEPAGRPAPHPAVP